MRLGVICLLLAAALCVSALAADSPPDGQYTYFTVTAGTCVTVTGKSNTTFTAKVTGAGENAECILLVTTDTDLPTADNLIYINQAQADASGKVTFENVIPKDMSAGGTYYVYATSATQTRADQTPAQFGYYYSEILLGDVNQNKEIASDDALLVLQSLAGQKTLNSTQEKAADVNKNGAVASDDALRILQYLAGQISSL